MSNNFRPPNMGIKPFDPIHQQRQMNELRASTAPGSGPISLPHPQMQQQMHMPAPQQVLIPNGNQPNNFARLRAMFSR